MPWFRDQNGQPVWVDDTPAQQPDYAVPPDPYLVQRRNDEAARAQAGEARAAAGEARAAQSFQNDQETIEARGGVDTTESEKTAAFLATRVAGGIEMLGRIDGRDNAPSYWEKIASGSDLGNYATTEERQRINAAQLDILDAALTLGTGAAYTKEQLEGYRRSYFPQPGDKPATIADKRDRLQILLESARVKAGGASRFIDTAIADSGVFRPSQPQPRDNARNTSRDGGEYDAQGNFLGLSGTVTDERDVPPSPTASRPQSDYRDSYLGQGMSGLNEGIASTLGAPVDLATMGLNLIPQGLNAAANTNLPTIENPVGGSQWIQDRMGGWSIYDQSQDPGKQFARRAGQSIGAAAVPLAGAPLSMGRAAQGLGIAAGGGVGAAAAQQAFPNNPAAEFTGEVLGSGLTAGGLLGSARRSAMKQAIEDVPSRENLRDQASGLYSAAESRGIVAGPNVTTNLAGRIGDIADREKMRWPTGEVDPNYTRAGAALKMMDAHSGQSIDPRQIQVMRENLMDAVRATEGKERRIASQMLDAFDEETVPLAPELADARRVASRYLQSDQINRARELAEPRAAQYTGSGMENALRTEFRKLDRNMVNDKQRFNPAVEQAINNVSRGTPWSNAMRTLGKAAPTGAVSTGLSAGVPFMVGNAVGGPAVGAAASATTMGMGLLGRRAATKAVENEARMADVYARNGGLLQLPPLVDDETQKALQRALLGQSTQYLPR